MSGKFQKASHLRCLAIAIDLEKELNLSFLNEALKDWIESNLDQIRPCENRPKLVFQIFQGNYDEYEMMNIYLTELLDVIVENKKIWSVSVTIIVPIEVLSDNGLLLF
ncbi:unnamed protein product [Ambrosiozyma monospora]|uniref:Unnamed protein product n=1 Tax=Ambrosiozyma monospora TaxID=43982 RepID=A0ACB5THD7_AMBMO|nr:unnamed protein product [Ambrosiozyma monospora]